jgi:hypothetical protein
MKTSRRALLVMSQLAFLSAAPAAVLAQDGASEATVAPPDTTVAPPDMGAPPPPPPEYVAASEQRAENSIYGEALGAGLVYSVNYERLVIQDLAVRVGLSYMSFSSSVSSGSSTSSSSITYMTFPIEISYLGIGNPHHIFEVGGGVSLLYASGSASGLGYESSGSGMGYLGNVLFGYRLHPVGHPGFHLRVGMMVFIGKGLGFSVDDPGAVGYLPWPYLSLGASF